MSTTVAIDVAHIQQRNAILNRKYTIKEQNITLDTFLKESSDVNQFAKTQRPSAAFM